MTTVFFVAHPDDEAFGPSGTIATRAQDEHVVVVSICNGKRPGAEWVSSSRQEAFRQSCNLLGAEGVIFDNPDVCLTQSMASEAIVSIMNEYHPAVVYTHNASDLHADHRVVFLAALTACRPTPASTVNAFYTFEIPGSTEWTFNQISPVFAPTTFVNVEEFMPLKKRVLSLYASEIHNHPDARSIESMVIMAQNRGKQIGVNYAEATQLIYARDHKTP